MLNDTASGSAAVPRLESRDFPKMTARGPTVPYQPPDRVKPTRQRQVATRAGLYRTVPHCTPLAGRSAREYGTVLYSYSTVVKSRPSQVPVRYRTVPGEKIPLTVQYCTVPGPTKCPTSTSTTVLPTTLQAVVYLRYSYWTAVRVRVPEYQNLNVHVRITRLRRSAVVPWPHARGFIGLACQSLVHPYRRFSNGGYSRYSRCVLKSC